uniref:HIG1 domain-containing protein n=1 Tax=Hyaloperonospora arabidopsidis (strain Emoy2) TaxID=559515 RepID=M4C2M2_HYAAE
MNGFPMETGWQKMGRRCREEPLVPVGCLATAGVLIGGLASFRRAADAATQQKFMRLRVAAQGATVIAMALGGFIAIKPKRNDPAKYDEQ